MSDHISEMLYALTSAYSRKDYDNQRQQHLLETSIGKLFSIFAWGLDTVEEQAGLIRLWDNIDYARGKVLDRYGANFGVKRFGTTDSLYRLAIKIKVLSQLSGGDIDTVIRATASLIGVTDADVLLEEDYPAKIVLYVNIALVPQERLDLLNDIIAALKRIIAVGVGFRLRICVYRDVGIIIETHRDAFPYHSHTSGEHECGTIPWRSTVGGVGDASLEIETGAGSFGYSSPAAGTEPWRSTSGGLQDSDLEVESAGSGYSHRSSSAGQVEAGTEPWRATGGAVDRTELEVDTLAQGKVYGAPVAGTKPYRSVSSGVGDAGVVLDSEAEGWLHRSSACGKVESGTSPERSTHGSVHDEALQLDAEALGFAYSQPVSGKQETGTEPRRNIGGAEQIGAFYADADGRGFHYHVKWCGTSHCKS